jgi:biotin operon repressor
VNTTTSNPLSDLEPRWARLGVLFNCAPAAEPPDIERTLLDTARALPDNPRLLPLVLTWLTVHGSAVARHRLKHLITTELEPEHQPALGLLLEESIARGAPAELRIARDACRSADQPGPLTAAFRAHQDLVRVAESQASPSSRRWGVWFPPVEPKPDAIRPVAWIRFQNPSWASRVIRRGDLRASILEALRLDLNGAADSIASLAQATSATRLAVTQAVHALEQEGAVRHEQRPEGARSRSVTLNAA